MDDDMLCVEFKARSEVDDLSSRVHAVANGGCDECDDTIILVRTTLVEQSPETRERIGGARPNDYVCGRAGFRNWHNETFQLAGQNRRMRKKNSGEESPHPPTDRSQGADGE
jgi:hypothetical protein